MAKESKKKGKGPTGTQAELEQAEKEMKEHLRLAREIDRCQLLFDDATEARKKAKADLEDAKKRLPTYIKQMSKPLPLLDGEKQPAAEGATAEAPAPGSNDAWKKVRLSEVILSGTGLKSFAAADIKTLGDLTAFVTKETLNGFEGPLARGRVPGIGKQKAEKIQAEIDGWWDAHPQYRERGLDKPGAKPPQEPKTDEATQPAEKPKDLKGGLDVDEKK